MALDLQAHASCYYPDGTYQPADRPCINDGTQESFCCEGQGVTCLSDKVCWNNYTTVPSAKYVRGSCTDQSFGSSACPRFCLTPSNGAGLMYQCGEQTDSYCCSPDGSPCSCETSNITLAASLSDVSSIAFPISNTGIETHVESSSTTSVINSSSATTTTSAVATPELTLSSSTLPSVTVISSTTLTPSVSASPPETPVSSDPSSSSHGNSKEAAAIGAPVTILAVVIILLVSLLIRQKRRTQSTMANFLGHLLKSSSSAEKPVEQVEQQRSELPAVSAAVEMEVRMERPELTA